MPKIIKLILVFLSIISKLLGDDLTSESIVCDGPAYINDVAFLNLGIYRGYMSDGSEYQKSYFIPRTLKADWAQSKGLCKAFDLELATYETINEALTFLKLIENFNVTAFLPTPKYFYIDGFTTSGPSKTDWYWTKNGNKILYNIPWAPYEPTLGDYNENCLSIGKNRLDLAWGFNDIHCQNENKTFIFICQRMDFHLPTRVN
ncbi:hypothetical protein ACKWTF_008515 [Chironomus riparius]